MKELSIEEKARAYDIALEKIEMFLGSGSSFSREELEYVFPELKENEDEKTKRILHSISSKMSFHLRDIFTEEEFQCFDTWSNAWLEKQGEKKSSWSEEDEENFARVDYACLKVYGGDSYSSDWLRKFLGIHKKWKPSDEQMEYLAKAILTLGNEGDCKTASILNELRTDLKKL